MFSFPFALSVLLLALFITWVSTLFAFVFQCALCWQARLLPERGALLREFHCGLITAAQSDAPRSMEGPPQSKREHLRRLVAAKQEWNEPMSADTKARGFKGWHERGYLPHCDKPGLVQFITFRLFDSMPAGRRGEWEHLLSINSRSDAPRSGAAGNASRSGAQSIAPREQRIKLEEYLDRGLGECFLRDPPIAALTESAMLHHHGQRFQLLAWIIMPNHVHALLEVGSAPLSKIVQNWKSIVAVEANKLSGRTGRFWQPDYWDRFMRDEEQKRKALHYIENNPVKAKLCRIPEEWPFGSARFRDRQTQELKLPP
jgi:putative transposase